MFFRRKLGQRFVLSVGIVVFLSLVVVFLWLQEFYEKALFARIEEQARMLFIQVILTRKLPISYGITLVKKNPADEKIREIYEQNLQKIKSYSAFLPYRLKRELHEEINIRKEKYVRKKGTMNIEEFSPMVKETNFYSFHITSLNLKNPQNAPDPFEATYLKEFERGEKEVSRIEIKDGRKVLHYMAPLYREERCLSCHNYSSSESKVAGSLSIFIPLKEYSKDINRIRTIYSGIFLVIVLMVIGFVYFLVRNWLINPLTQLHQGMEKISRGDFSFRLNLNTGDEIQQVAEGYNRIAENLRNSYETIEKEAKEKGELYVETKKMYEELKNTEERLTQSEKLSTLGRMAAGIVHELNNPLTAILGYTQLVLSEMKRDIPQYDDLKRVEQEAKRILKITQNLLTYSRPASTNFEPVEITAVIDRSLGLVQHEIKHKNLEIVKNYDNNLPLIKADENEFTQVFVNLFTNALHSFKEKEKPYKIAIGVKYNQITQTIEIEISDTGEGILPENLKHIFEPFFTTKEKNKGTGLGLFVVYGIIQRYKSKIEVKSDINRGTTFLITLPVFSDKEIQ